MPGGVNSPVRAFRGVGGNPVFFEKGEGAWLTDVDGNRYVDYVGSLGPDDPRPRAPGDARGDRDGRGEGHLLRRAARGRGRDRRADLRDRPLGGEGPARLLRAPRRPPRRSGSRAARPGATAILKFEGCYHGAGDSFLVKAGSGVETLGLPDSPGVPARRSRASPSPRRSTTSHAVEQVFAEHGVAHRRPRSSSRWSATWACSCRSPGFLEGLQALCRKHGALFILDEVMTGFRLARGGAQELYGCSRT